MLSNKIRRNQHNVCVHIWLHGRYTEITAWLTVVAVSSCGLDGQDALTIATMATMVWVVVASMMTQHGLSLKANLNTGKLSNHAGDRTGTDILQPVQVSGIRVLKTIAFRNCCCMGRWKLCPLRLLYLDVIHFSLLLLVYGKNLVWIVPAVAIWSAPVSVSYTKANFVTGNLNARFERIFLDPWILVIWHLALQRVWSSIFQPSQSSMHTLPATSKNDVCALNTVHIPILSTSSVGIFVLVSLILFFYFQFRYNLSSKLNNA